MFQLLDFTAAQLVSVTNRTETHGDEKVPAVSIGLEFTAPNTILDQIDPKLREALYVPVTDQEDLPGIERSTPVLRCNSIDRVVLPTSHEGWTLLVDDGIDESTPMTFGGVKVDKFTVEPHQGGSITLRLRCGTSDITAETLGKLGMHNGSDIWVMLTAPAKQADAIDGTGKEFAADHPEADATDLFAGAGQDIDGEDAGPELEDRLDHALAMADAGAASKFALDAVGSPFGTREAELQAEAAPSAIERSQPSTRTARGRQKTAEALAAGLAAARV